MRSAPAIAFDYRPSRLIAVAGGIISALALLGIAASGLPMILKFVLSMLALFYGVIHLRRYLDSNIVRLAHGASGWSLVDREGREWVVKLEDHVHRGLLMVLVFSGEDSPKRRFVFVPDNIDGKTRRRLLLVLAAGDGKAR